MPHKVVHGVEHMVRHIEHLGRRWEWFEHSGEPTSVTWWIRAGSSPSVGETHEHLLHLRGTA